MSADPPNLHPQMPPLLMSPYPSILVPPELNFNGTFSFTTQYSFCKSSIFQMFQVKGMKYKLGLVFLQHAKPSPRRLIAK